MKAVVPQRQVLIIGVVFQALSPEDLRNKRKVVQHSQKLKILLNFIKQLQGTTGTNIYEILKSTDTYPILQSLTNYPCTKNISGICSFFRLTNLCEVLPRCNSRDAYMSRKKEQRSEILSLHGQFVKLCKIGYISVDFKISDILVPVVPSSYFMKFYSIFNF